jgi:hypothetical protein
MDEEAEEEEDQLQLYEPGSGVLSHIVYSTTACAVLLQSERAV